MAVPSNLSILRRAFADVCRGYSTVPFKGRPLVVKHLAHTDHIEYDSLRIVYEEEARAKGAITDADRLKDLTKQGLWTPAREAGIATQIDFLHRLEDGKKGVAVPSILKAQDQQIAQERAKLEGTYQERATLFGVTTEVYAQQQLNDHYIVTNLFLDKECLQPLFSSSSFDDLTDAAVREVTQAYQRATEPCSEANLKTLAVQDFFIRYYSLCGDNLYSFYGRPVANLTFYQVRLGNVARYYKQLMENCDLSRLPPDQRNDPEAIDRAYTTQRNATPMIEEGKVPVGMNREDIKELGLQGRLTPLPRGNQSFQQMIQRAQAGNGGTPG